jgi:hypothetical protein
MKNAQSSPLQDAYDIATARIKALEAALQAIMVRCEEGDKKFDWIPTIASIAREALAPEQNK